MNEYLAIEKLFGCPRCQIGLRLDEANLVASCTKCDFVLYHREGLWLDPRFPDLQPTNYYQDIDYCARQNAFYSTSRHEYASYTTLLEEACSLISKDALLVDLGCGDGRFTRFLLSVGFHRIIAVDIDAHNLKRLATRLTSEEKSKTILLQADCAEIPLIGGQVDAIVAIGLFNIFYERLNQVICRLRDILSPNGIMVNTDPTLEGSLLYALVRHDFEEFLCVARTHTKTIDYDGQRDKRMPVFAEGELEAILEQSGFRVEYVKGISVFPSLVFGGIFQINSYSETMKQEVARVVDELSSQNIPVYRVKMYLSRKTGKIQ